MKTRFTLLTLFLLILTLSAISQREGDWTMMNPTNAPEARYGHSMVTIPDGRVMLFGGEGSQQDLFNDLIVYNNYNWEELTPTNEPPAPRRDHEAWMQGDEMFVYGGTGEDGPFNDMWSYDISDNEWNEVALSGTRPCARYGQTNTPVSDGSVLILGGIDSDGNKLNDFWRMFGNHTFEQLPNAPRFYSHHIAHLVNDDILLVFGEAGKVGLYQFSAGMWGETNSDLPISGFAGSCVANNDLGEEVLFIFGGKDADGNDIDIVYMFNTVTGELTQRDDPLPGTVNNGASAKYYDNGKDNEYHVLLFGGVIDGEISNATWMSTSNLLSLEEIQVDNKYNVQITPNPTSGPLLISANKKIGKISIYDVTGMPVKEMIASNKEVSVNLSSFENGIYFVKTQIDNNIISGKIMLIK